VSAARVLAVYDPLVAMTPQQVRRVMRRYGIRPDDVYRFLASQHRKGS